jgi:hypothetical protein
MKLSRSHEATHPTEAQPEKRHAPPAHGSAALLTLQRIAGNRVTARFVSSLSPSPVQRVLSVQIGPDYEIDVEARVSELLQRAEAGIARQLRAPVEESEGRNSGFGQLLEIQALIKRAGDVSRRAVITPPIKARIAAAITSVYNGPNSARVGALEALASWVNWQPPVQVPLLPGAAALAAQYLCDAFERDATWGDPMVNAHHIAHRHLAALLQRDGPRRADFGHGTTSFFPLSWDEASLLPVLKSALSTTEAVAAVQAALAARQAWFVAHVFVKGSMVAVGGELRRGGSALTAAELSALDPGSATSPPNRGGAYLHVHEFRPVGFPTWDSDTLRNLIHAYPSEGDFIGELIIRGQPI